mmetsp:Transcript_91406/g.167750  ORF Transcript_91406/g.167750 Transcript_91406/m.167750 type:complete len:116 (+) Transcript_91406:55-402(+)
MYLQVCHTRTPDTNQKARKVSESLVGSVGWHGCAVGSSSVGVRVEVETDTAVDSPGPDCTDVDLDSDLETADSDVPTSTPTPCNNRAPKTNKLLGIRGTLEDSTAQALYTSNAAW